LNRFVGLVSFFAFLLASHPAVALDWGVDVHEVPIYLGGSSTVLIDSFSSNVWVTSPLAGADFKIEGVGSGSVVSTGGNIRVGTPSVDLSVLTLSGINALDNGKSGVLAWTVGRHAETDQTGGWIVNSPWDGFKVGWQTGSMGISAAAGYSGLILKSHAKTSLTAQDLADLTDNNVVFGPQRILATTGITWNEVAFRQDISAELLGQYDLRSGSNRLHAGYGTLGVTGPLPGGLRHRTFGSFNLTQDTGVLGYGYLAGLEISETIPFLGTRIVATGTLGKGILGAGFQTISGNTLADVASLTTTNAGSVRLDGSIRPWPKTTLGAKATSLWRATENAVAMPGFLSDTKESWLGGEIGFYASWNPSVEWSLGSVGGAFVPNPKAFASGTAISLLFVITATLKL